MKSPRVKTGLDVLVEEGFKRLQGLKVGFLGHPASVDRELRHAVYLMHEAGVKLAALFGPEHGVTGDAQDMEVVEESNGAQFDRLTGARLYSLYGATEASLRPTQEMLEGLDVLVVDMQDVGARYYTFAASMGYVMEAAAARGLRVMVLDRPNPLGGRAQDVEGPSLDAGFLSFVGAYPMPIRHGLTMAEYARWVGHLRGLDLNLEFVLMTGWQRGMDFDATGLPWVMPSPNMPTLDTAFVYPGQCLLEGTNLSEGRGTTRPFELCGAPWLDGVAWAQYARDMMGSGVVLRPTYFKPMFQKWGGARCGGVQMHVTDRRTFRPVQAAVALIRSAMKLEPANFAWRTEAYEYVSDRLAIDLLFGSEKPRRMLEEGATVEDVTRSFADAEQDFRETRSPLLLYAS